MEGCETDVSFPALRHLVQIVLTSVTPLASSHINPDPVEPGWRAFCDEAGLRHQVTKHLVEQSIHVNVQ